MTHDPQNRTQWIEYIQEALGDLSKFQRHLVAQFKIDLGGIHGVDHWLRVYSNGIRLSAMTGAKEEVIRWFSLLHDSCRQSNGSDPDHGPRAANLARNYKEEIDLPPAELDLLIAAVASHTIGCSTMADITIQTCLDADRLDLTRIGITPRSELLYTSAAKMEASQGRSSQRNAKFPIKVKCINCGRKLQALRPGRYQCPTCRFLVEVSEEGRIYLC